jgi:hypothetical protein
LDGDKAMTNLITFSSRLTFFYKVIFPVIWISGFGLGMIVVVLAHDPPLAVKFAFAAGWVLGAGCWVLSVLRGFAHRSRGFVPVIVHYMFRTI